MDFHKEIELYHTLGLCGEAGELANLINKSIRNDKPVDVKKVIEELGDILWYWFTICEIYQLEPDEVAKENVRKLAIRKSYNTIKER